MIGLSKAHLEEVGEGYLEHLGAALRISSLLVRAGVACAIHAIVPGLCTRSASRCLAEIESIFHHRRETAAAGQLPDPSAQFLSS